MVAAVVDVPRVSRAVLEQGVERTYAGRIEGLGQSRQARWAVLHGG